MSHLATPEDDHNLHAVTILEEFVNFAEFDTEVVVADFQAEFHRFKLRLFFAGFFAIFRLFFHLLVLVFTPVDDFDNRGIRISGNLDKVNTLVVGDGLSFFTRHDAELLTAGANYADFWITNFSINPGMLIVTNVTPSFLVSVLF